MLRPHRWWTLAAVSLTQLLMVLDGTIVNIALPSAQAELGLSDAARQWVVTGYALAFGSFLLLGGRIADFWGRKRSYLLGLAMFGAASVWGGLTHSGAELVAARCVQGLAAAFLAPAALAFVTLAFPEQGGRAQPGLRRLRVAGRSRLGRRHAARRAADRAPVLAVVPAGQRARGRRRAGGRGRAAAREPGRGGTVGTTCSAR